VARSPTDRATAGRLDPPSGTADVEPTQAFGPVAAAAALRWPTGCPPL